MNLRIQSLHAKTYKCLIPFPLFSKENVCLPVSTRLLGVQQEQWVWWMKWCRCWKCVQKIVHCTAVCKQNKSVIQLLQLFKTLLRHDQTEKEEMYKKCALATFECCTHLCSTCLRVLVPIRVRTWQLFCKAQLWCACMHMVVRVSWKSAAAPAAWAVKPTLYLLLFSSLDLI